MVHSLNNNVLLPQDSKLKSGFKKSEKVFKKFLNKYKLNQKEKV